MTLSLTTADDTALEIAPSEGLRVRVRGLAPGATTPVTTPVTTSISVCEQAPEAIVVGPDLAAYRVEAVDAVVAGDRLLSGSRLALAPIFLGLALVLTAGLLSRRRARPQTA